AGDRGNAALAISGIAEAGHFAALIDADGAILAASRGLDGLGLDDGALAALAADANHESDRLAKRPLPAGALLYPAGIARLADQPARHLVIVVDAPQPAAPEAASEPEAQVPAADSAPLSAPAETAAKAVVSTPHETDSWYFADAAPRTVAVPDTGPAALIEEPGQDDGVDEIMLDALPEDEAEPPFLAPADVEDAARLPEQIAEQGSTAGSRPPEADEAAIAGTADTFATMDPLDTFPTPSADAEDAVQSWEQDNAPSPVAAEGVSMPVADDAIDATEAAGDLGTMADGADASPASSEPAEQVSAPQHTAERIDADTGETADGEPFVPDLAAGPVRFVWRTDALGRFSAISNEFAGAVGKRSADVIGRSLRDVTLVFGLDPDGEIAGLLARRDTWSGRSVMWPIEGTDLSVPVDLAALPVYARDRSFEGFRGFGVVRVGDAVVDPEAIGLSLTSAPTEPPAEPTSVFAATPADGEPPARDPFKGELPAIAVDDTPERRLSDKVIRLAEHRPATPERTLSPGEKIAFREIGARLKDAGSAEDTSQNSDGSDDPEGEPAELASEALADDAHEAPEPALAFEDDEDFAPTAMGPDASDVDSVAETGDSEANWDELSAAPDEVVAPDAADETDDRFAYVAADESMMTDASEEPVYVEDGPAPDAARADDRMVDALEARQDVDAPDMSGEPVRDKPDDVAQPDFPRGEDDERAPTGIDTSILGRLPVPVLIHSADKLHYANQEFFDLTGYVSVLELEQAGGLDVLFADEEHDATRDPADHRRRL
ncbi:MAG: hypothetical protein Q8Q62_17950, partial [Mesorhizobium sp.]|nr:hypothetical protein [Mesorhizobium sp.]